jgi:hypothetical protein
MLRRRLARLFLGGTAGNERLTANTASVLIVLLAVEGATLLSLRSFLPVHVFVGMLLIPPVALKRPARATGSCATTAERPST